MSKKKSAGARPTQRLKKSLGMAFDGHGADMTGLILIMVGFVAALGIYVDVVGPLGEGLDWFAGGTVGVAKFVVPLGLVALGVLLIRGPELSEDAPKGAKTKKEVDARRDESIRMVVGSILVTVAVAGLLHVIRGNPVWSTGVEGLADAGGVIGFAVGSPLAAVAARLGAGLVLGALGIVGLLVLTRGRLSVALDAATAVGKGLKRTWAIVADSFESAPAGDEGPAHQVPTHQPEAAPAKVAAVPTPATKAPKVKKPKIKLPEIQSADQLEIDLRPAMDGSPWVLPPMALLGSSGDQEVDHTFVEEAGRILEHALAAHGVETRVVGMVVGPTVTRYELELGPGVKVARVTSLHKDIAYAMASPDVRILAPIPGRQAIGVEVPNQERSIVALGDLLQSAEARNATGPLTVPVGRDITGKTHMMDLAKMPHILIAGATGSGKSSAINTIITSILMRTTPEEVRMILIDPKMVEMTQYERVPHLLTQPVTDPKKAANALAWACREMDRRYELLSSVRFRDLDGYNKAVDDGKIKVGMGELGPDGEPKTYKRLPKILVVVDELADLMMVAARDVEDSICRIAQKARAVGIHLIIATQRPSTNVITGIIKANIPTRLAFAVSSLTDSRVILDQSGAERLIGQGDMLMVTAASSIATRIQGAWVTEEEVRDIVGVWRNQEPESVESESVQAESILDAQPGTGVPGTGAGGGDAGSDDELFKQARELVVSSQLGSTSMLQRKLRVGFARAGRLMDMLEDAGVVGPSVGSKPREVLVDDEGNDSEADDPEDAMSGV